jgi:hypothetical protein
MVYITKMISFVYNMIAFLVQMLIYVVASLAISYCLYVIFKKSDRFQDNIIYVETTSNKEKVDYDKINAEIEAMKAKMAEQNKRFEEAVAQVTIAELNAKVREKKLDILDKCATINGRIIEYLVAEGQQIPK